MINKNTNLKKQEQKIIKAAASVAAAENLGEANFHEHKINFNHVTNYLL